MSQRNRRITNDDDADERVLKLLADYSRGKKDALLELLDVLSDRFYAKMAAALHGSFQRATHGEQGIGTQTLAQAVRTRIRTGIDRGTIKEINDVDHLMAIAGKNARWFLLDAMRKRTRAEIRAAKYDGRSKTAAKFWLLMDEFAHRIPAEQSYEFCQAVQKCSEHLPEDQKQVFDRRFFLTNAEIAREIGLDPTTTRGRWDMANSSLRKCLLSKFPLPSSKSA